MAKRFRNGFFVLVALAVVVGFVYFMTRSNPAPGVSLADRLAGETELATAGANGLKPALVDLAKRINEAREAIKAQTQKTDALTTRVKTIEDRPAFDFKKYEEELKKKVIEGMPPSVPMSEYKALQQNFPLRSAA